MILETSQTSYNLKDVSSVKVLTTDGITEQVTEFNKKLKYNTSKTYSNVKTHVTNLYQALSSDTVENIAITDTINSKDMIMPNDIDLVNENGVIISDSNNKQTFNFVNQFCTFKFKAVEIDPKFANVVYNVKLNTIKPSDKIAFVESSRNSGYLKFTIYLIDPTISEFSINITCFTNVVGVGKNIYGNVNLS